LSGGEREADEMEMLPARQLKQVMVPPATPQASPIARRAWHEAKLQDHCSFILTRTKRQLALTSYLSL